MKTASIRLKANVNIEFEFNIIDFASWQVSLVLLIWVTWQRIELLSLR